MTRPGWDQTWLDVAGVIARRSRCSRAKVGAVIVDRSNRIVSTGYNGPPAEWLPNMMSLDLPRDYLDNCDHWCQRAQEGPTADTAQSYSDCTTLHAELNALLFVDRRQCEGGTLYLTGSPCWTCAKAVANSGLARLVIASEDLDVNYRKPDESYDLLKRCGLEVVQR